MIRVWFEKLQLAAALVLLSCSVALTPAIGAVPTTLNFQGQLTNASGTPINASVNMTFALYDALISGNLLWSETDLVVVTNGYYSVALGSQAAAPLNPSVFNVPLYLGISVGTDAEMTPRISLTSAPYAFQSGGNSACGTGTIDCNGTCVTLSSDPNNCGACGNTCATGGSCSNGVCISCPIGKINCNGTCVNTSNDPSNCGACGMTCSTSNATAVCTAGVCAIGTCSPGYGDCDHVAANGCETSLSNSLTNCGTCGNACATTVNGTSVCNSGNCQIGSCNAGWGDCDGNPTNGCETSLSSSVTNCGTCGNVCSTPNGTPACNAGTCQTAYCNAGYADCDRNATNGCEVNINNDSKNCGGCGNACASGKACVAGACT